MKKLLLIAGILLGDTACASGGGYYGGGYPQARIYVQPQSPFYGYGNVPPVIIQQQPVFPIPQFNMGIQVQPNGWQRENHFMYEWREHHGRDRD